MKLLSIFLLLAFVACESKKVVYKSKEEIAKDSISAYLQSHLHDPTSFQLVHYSKFDTVYTSAYDDKRDYYKGIQDSLFDEAGKHYILSKEHKLTWDLGMSYFDTLTNLLNDTTYRGKFIGYAISHKYRAKNQMGALGLHTVLYSFDSSMNIINVMDED